jgi:predicted acyltransferase (DUF342 family)
MTLVLPPWFAFIGVLLLMLLWLALPLIPAIMELIRPKDAAPLNAVGSDSGNLTFFAESFTARAQREGLFNDPVPEKLADGSRVLAHSTARPLPIQRKPFTDFVVITDNAPFAEGTEFASECLARSTLISVPSTTFRTLLGQQDVVLAQESTVLRWVHVKGHLEVASNSRLLGRATAERSITVGPQVVFDRLSAPYIRVGNEEVDMSPVLPIHAYERYTPDEGRVLAPQYWRVEEDFNLPAARGLVGSVISTGKVEIDEDARVTGSLKAHETLIIRAGAIVDGSVTARGPIRIEDGARVLGSVISEEAIILEGATIGGPGQLATVTAPIIRVRVGAIVHGAIIAAKDGKTVV